MKKDGAEFIVVSMHWGEEYKQTPNSYQINLAKMMANEGVDLILGSHPHVVQPIEYVASEDGKKNCLVVYSQGNIISDQREEDGQRNSENGIMPIVKITKDANGLVKISDAKYIPSWVNKVNKDGKDFYEIIPIDDSIEVIKDKYSVQERSLNYSYENTKKLIKDSKIKPSFEQ